MEETLSFQGSNAVGDGGYSARSIRSRKIKYSVFDGELDKFDDVNLEVKKKKKKPLKVNTDLSLMDSFSKSTNSLLSAQQVQNMINPGKRPRGRPPLSTKRQNTVTMTHSSQNGSISSQYNHLSSIQSHHNFSSGNKSLNNGQEAIDQPKLPRPPYKMVADKVVSKLMVSDPLSLSDLTKKLLDCPRDMIQAVLDILQVLGVVVQHKAKDNLRAEYPSGVAVFSLIQFVKSPTPVELHELHDEIIRKSCQIQRVDLRLSELEVLFSN